MNHSPSSPTLLERVVTWFGAVSLILLGALICASVGLRMIDSVIKGSSEIGEMLIIIVAATSIVTATLTDAHPHVHMLVDKLRRNIRYRLAALIGLVGAAFWATIAWVNGIEAVENAVLVEETELLRISVIPFRWIWIACLIAVAAVLAIRAIRLFRSSHRSNV